MLLQLSVVHTSARYSLQERHMEGTLAFWPFLILLRRWEKGRLQEGNIFDLLLSHIGNKQECEYEYIFDRHGKISENT